MNETENNTQEENAVKPEDYSCVLLLENATIEKANNPNFPLDAYNVFYKQDDKLLLDVCRGSKIKIFDYYYDKYGKNCVQRISWGYGKVNPKLWMENRKSKPKKR